MSLELIIREPVGTRHPIPLLCVPGIHHGAWCYEDYLLPYFAQQGFVAAAVSLRGHGASSIQGELRWARVHDYVEDVEQAAQQLAATYGARPVIIGHSMGGLTTQKYLEKYTAPGGVLLASVPTHGMVFGLLKVFTRYPLRILRGIITFDLNPVILHSPDAVRTEFFSKDIAPDLLMRHYQRMGRESFLIFFDMLILGLPRPSRVKAPVLVVAGEDDTLFAPWEEARLARAYNGKYHVISGMAHDLMLEKDWQQVAQLIIEWAQALAA